MSARKTLLGVLAVQAVLLLGCQELNTCFGLIPQNNKPTATDASATATGTAAASASPSATPTSGLASVAKAFDTSVKSLDKSVEQLDDKAAAVKGSYDEAVESIDEDDERALGQAASLSVLAENGGLVLDQALIRYVNEVGNLVAQQGSRQVKTKKGVLRVKTRRFFFAVLDDPSVNAYALPGGYVYVTRGLLESLSSESELAFVLGHEISHVDLEHGLLALKLHTGATAGWGEMKAQFGKKAEGADAKETGMKNQEVFDWFVEKIVGAVVKSPLNREYEYAADQLGATYAIGAGYDADGARRVLEALAAHGGRKLRLSHAQPQTRLEKLQAKLAESKGKRNVGVLRYDTDCLQRLEAAQTAAAATP